MPVDDNGVVFDAIMDPTSIVSRMNLGRLYEQYFNAASRIAKTKVIEYMDKHPKDIEGAFDIVLRFIKIFETEQYEGYLDTTLEEKKMILDEVREKELYILYRLSSKKPAWVIVNHLQKSEFKPLKAPVSIKGKDGIVRKTRQPVLGGPLYHILLSKTPHEFFSAVSSAYTNHYGFPIAPSSSKKHETPIKENPVRFISETEFRSYLAYGGPELIAELKHRGNSLRDHRVMYENMLNGTCRDDLVPRDVYKYDSDSTLRILNTVFHVMGLDLTYQRDALSQFGPFAKADVGLKGQPVHNRTLEEVRENVKRAKSSSKGK